ncbi:MAG: hypothetical protein KC443_05470 [Anaerolineales bacterium]|nr:hypothetical protein [Anaerolineales bacterium]MCB8968217.1 hypothetical protein [Ardenticatenaceae bacterium]
MMRKKVLFIGGSLNQTKMAHAVAKHLQAEHDCYFTPYYSDHPLLHRAAQKGWLDFTVMGGAGRRQTEAYLAGHNLPLDYGGRQHAYDLVVTGSDLIIQRNIRQKPIILIQEGMTDPENVLYHLVRRLKLPRYLASTSTNGLSLAYRYFCVASEGYKQFFIRKGIPADRMVVTGMPNYDDVRQVLRNDFPHRGYVLAATSDARETFKFDNRKRFIRHVLAIANGRSVIFKLHPNEKEARARREIDELAPEALVFAKGSVDHMIANCDVLVTQYSTVVYTGIVLGKEVHSYFDVAALRALAPWQNGGTSGQRIAQVCRGVLAGETAVSHENDPVPRPGNAEKQREGWPIPPISKQWSSS